VTEELEKECRKCRDSFPLDFFPNRKQSRDGKDSYCKVCKHAMQKACRTPEQMQRYYKKNREYNKLWKKRKREEKQAS